MSSRSSDNELLRELLTPPRRVGQGMACAKCAKFFRRIKSGVVVEEGMPTDRDQKEWGPYKLWRADLFECPQCKTQVIAGFAQHNFAEHYQDDYAEKRDKEPPIVTVNDCGGMKP
jgi:hypothetical protein